MEYVGVLGFAVAGALLPEFIMALSTRNVQAPMGQNFWSAISAGLISASFLIN